MADLEPIAYSDAKIRAILERVGTIALVGASANWNRPSYFVMKYLQGKGYRVIPVNPGIAGKRLLGEMAYASLRDIPDKVDMVDVFRRSEDTAPIVEDAVAIGAEVVWMQLGVRNDAAAKIAEAAGLEVIMNRCPKIEFGRLGGELSWSGVNSGIIQNRPPAAPLQRRVKSRPASSHNLDYGFETRAIHAGAAPDPTTGARSTPIYQTTAYVFDDVDHAASLFNLHNFGYIYSRLTNPTVSVLEERIAALEGGRAAVAAASGHAAQFLTFFTLMEPGDEFVASRNLYGGSLTQFGLSFKKLGWTCHFVDPTDPENFRKALTPKCKAIFIENLANPGGVVVDIAAVAKVAHEAGLPLIVDNTLATPYLCRPFEHGADIVVHSTTKFLAGHGNSLGGVVVEVGQVRLVARGPLSLADRAGARLSRAQVFREFWRFRLHHEGACGGLARFRPRACADECLPHHHRRRDAARANGAARRERAESRRIPEPAPEGRLGVVRESEGQRLLQARAKVSAERRRRGVHLRRQRRLRSRRQAGRGRTPVLASGEYWRHAQPDPASGVHHPSTTHRRAARLGGGGR